MPQINYTLESRLDLVRLTEFLLSVAPESAVKAIDTILESIEILEQSPEIGRQYESSVSSVFRELVIRHGRGGYLALYSFDSDADLVTIHAIRHQRELDYGLDS